MKQPPAANDSTLAVCIPGPLGRAREAALIVPGEDVGPLTPGAVISGAISLPRPL